MRSLSEQLQTLSDQAKKAEDVATAAKDRDRAQLAAHIEHLRGRTADLQQAAANGKDAVHKEWGEAQEQVSSRFAELRMRADQRRADRDVRRADRRADEAERDAADAIAFASLVVDGAIEAAAEALLARAVAEDLAARNS